MGPLYGALIVQHLGWTYIFFFNAPIVLALMIGAWFLIPKGKRLHEGIDWLGAILLGLMLTCLSLGLAQQGTELGPTSVNSANPQNNPVSLILALVFLLAFIVVELIPRWRVPRLSLSRRLSILAFETCSRKTLACCRPITVQTLAFQREFISEPVCRRSSYHRNGGHSPFRRHSTQPAHK